MIFTSLPPRKNNHTVQIAAAKSRCPAVVYVGAEGDLTPPMKPQLPLPLSFTS
jgi:hypothetical protein